MREAGLRRGTPVPETRARRLRLGRESLLLQGDDARMQELCYQLRGDGFDEFLLLDRQPLKS